MQTSFALGDVTIHRIVEMEGPFVQPLQVLPKLSAELLDENRGWLTAAGALDAQSMFVFCFQSYVVRTPHHTILIDSCIGNDKDRPTRPHWHHKSDDRYMCNLAAHGLGVEDIDYVLCTHLHADHVGWNTRLENGRWVPTFPKARYVFAAPEFAHWHAANAKGKVNPFADSVLPIVEANRADLVASDHALGDHVRLMPTPGHTPGHAAIAVGRGSDEAVFTGDLIHSPLQARYPELSIMFDVDMESSAATRRAFLERYCDTQTLCCTAHFPSPSVGHIKRWGDGFRCEMVTA